MWKVPAVGRAGLAAFRGCFTFLAKRQVAEVRRPSGDGCSGVETFVVTCVEDKEGNVLEFCKLLCQIFQIVRYDDLGYILIFQQMMN